MKVMLWLGILALLAVPFSIARGEQVLGQSDQMEKQTNQANTIPSAPAIGYLEMRDQHIAIKAGGVYTISTKDGKVLAKNVTLEQVQANYPSLHEALEHSIAADKNILDASVRIER